MNSNVDFDDYSRWVLKIKKKTIINAKMTDLTNEIRQNDFSSEI